MKIIENKKIFNKIIIILSILVISNFCFAGKVKAKDDDAKGGKLLNPIVDLFVFLGDGTMDIMHRALYHQEDSTIEVDMSSSVWDKIGGWVIGIGVAILAGAAIVLTGGILLPALIPAITAVGAGTVLVVSSVAGVAAGVYYSSNYLPQNLYLPIYNISPDKIFANEVLLLDVDFFNPKSSEKISYTNDDGEVQEFEIESTASVLRGTISNWYNILRDIAIVALLSILVYIGIRIVMSSTAKDKSKYKQLLMDWLVAICLLFIMQYIMAFSNLLVSKITDVVKNTTKETAYIPVLEDEDGKIEEVLTERGFDVSEYIQDGTISWPTDLLGHARINAQMGKKLSTAYAGNAAIFVILVLYTIYFLFTYLKRVLYMAFLTMIAPLVALTYPIDKMNDGKAQAFDMWLKEYIFNLLIQPMHFILYTILVTSAFDLAGSNIIYSLVALGFMMPAEKLLRRFFGFEKAKTPGLLAGPAGAALMMQGISKLAGKSSKGSGKSAQANNSKSSSPDDDGKPPRINTGFDKDDAIFGSGSNGGANNDAGNNNNGNDDNIIDLNEDEYSISDSENSRRPQLGLPMNDDYNDDDNNIIDLADDEYSIDGEKSNPTNSSSSGNQDGNNNTNDGQIRTDAAVGANQYKPKKKVKKHPLRAMGAASRYYVRGTKSNIKSAIKNRVANAHPLKTATRLAGGALGAATLGAAGAMVGITSGDPNKVFQYTAAGAMGGYKAGAGIINSANRFDSLTPNDMADVTERARYDSDDDYKQAQVNKYIKEFQKSEKNRFELERNYGKKEAKRIMKNDIPFMLENGVTDMKDIMAIEDAVKDNSVNINSVQEGVSIKKYASRMGNTDTTKMTEKKKDEWRNTFKKDFSQKEKYKNQNHDEMANSIINKVDAFSKIRFQ